MRTYRTDWYGSWPTSSPIHVREINLKAADDPLVWDYAKDNGLMIVSKDSDMHQRSFVFGYPPKVIWVRLGNCSTSDVEQLLRRHFAPSKRFTKTITRRSSVYRSAQSNNGMHPTADTTALIFGNLAGRRVMPGVRLFHRLVNDSWAGIEFTPPVSSV